MRVSHMVVLQCQPWIRIPTDTLPSPFFFASLRKIKTATRSQPTLRKLYGRKKFLFQIFIARNHKFSTLAHVISHIKY